MGKGEGKGQASANSQQKVTADTVNPNVVAAEYAVRGAIVIRAGELEKKLAAGEKLPFEKLVYCNIGNPQQLGQRPITYIRQCASLCDYPQLATDAPNAFPTDMLARAKTILDDVRSTGAYSHSKGSAVCRRFVAKGIEDRDGFPCDPENLYMTDGASPAVHLMIKLLIRGGDDAFLVPIPQYPLYSAGIQLQGGTLLPYYLKESEGWGLDMDALQKSVEKATGDGKCVRAMVVINPGNPTGQCLTQANQEEIVRFCVRHGLVLIADEVYQANVYAESKQFHSFKKIAGLMGVLDDLQLVSLHSISKGYLGECGRRGGYMEMTGFKPEVQAQVLKCASVNLCPNLSGQIAMANQMAPPKPGEPSYELYAQERTAILDSLKRRAIALCNALNELEGVSCQPAEGAMYCFPSITLPEKAVAAAKAAGQAADFMYCLQCLEATGIVVVPGSGFKQVEGTWHFRTTFLPSEEDIGRVIQSLTKFHKKFMDTYR